MFQGDSWALKGEGVKVGYEGLGKMGRLRVSGSWHRGVGEFSVCIA